MALKDLLAALPEDFKITVGDKEIDRAAVLAELENEVTPLNTRVTELTAREKQLQEERDAAIAAAGFRRETEHKEEPVDTKKSLLEAMRELVSGESEYNFADPYSTQLLNRIEKMIEGKTSGLSAAQKQQLDELQQGILGITAMTLQQQMNSEFRQHKWPEGYEPKRAWAEALKSGYYDPVTKIPDMARYNAVVMAPLLEKEKLDKAREEGIQEGIKQANEQARQRNVIRGRFAATPKPGSGPIGSGGKGGGKMPQRLGDAIDAIEITDADIAANTGLKAG